jgi:hypothetical protein
MLTGPVSALQNNIPDSQCDRGRLQMAACPQDFTVR